MQPIISRGKDTNPNHLERWLGQEAVEGITRSMKDFYWPIPVHGVPGMVFAMPGGGFSGEIKAGEFASAYDRAEGAVKRYNRARAATLARHRIAHSPFLRNKMDKRAHAFGSLSAVIDAVTGGKAQNLIFQKTGAAANTVGNSNDLFYRAGMPTAGAAGAAAPGGTVPTSASAGALPGYRNAASADTNHFLSGWANASVINNTLLMYDRLGSVAKTMNSTATEAVTNTPSRYQSTTPGNIEFAGGNFVYPANPTTVLPATAHNWVTCQYTDQSGNATQNFVSVAGVSACVVGGIDLAVGNWFLPFAAGDYGVQKLTQMQCSAAVATGTIDFVIAHPIAFFPCPVANLICPVDGLNTAFNLTTILDDACLSFIEMQKPATTATNYTGQIQIVSE